MTPAQRQRLANLARIDLGYNETAKAEFLRLARALARDIARDLGIQADIRTNRAGIAVSGEVTLHGDWLYVDLGQSMTGPEFMYRAVRGRKDYKGGHNRWMRWTKLVEDYEGALRDFAACQHEAMQLQGQGGNNPMRRRKSRKGRRVRARNRLFFARLSKGRKEKYAGLIMDAPRKRGALSRARGLASRLAGLKAGRLKAMRRRQKTHRRKGKNPELLMVGLNPGRRTPYISLPGARMYIRSRPGRKLKRRTRRLARRSKSHRRGMRARRRSGRRSRR